MNDQQSISDEMLNAFIDDQLDAEEREIILARRLHDPLIDKRLCELRRLKDMVHLARPDTSGLKEMPTDLLVMRRRHWPYGMAAGLLMAMLVSVFWLGQYSSYQQPLGNLQDLVEKSPTTQLKILVHYTQNDAESAGRLLDQVEQVLKQSESFDRPVQLEVLAHGKGIYLLNKSVTPYAERIRDLHQRYDNLRFVACQATMTRVKQAKGIAIELLPEAMVVHSGKAEIRLRRQQGWKYLQV